MVKSTIGIGILFLLVSGVLLIKHDAKPETSAEVLALRKAVLLEEEPEDLMGLIESREMIRDGQRVCVLGRVGGVKNPLEQSRAAFVIVDPSSEDVVAAGEHDGSCGNGCAFCEKIRDKQSVTRLARVEVVAADGEVIPFGAKELLSIEEGSLVVVQGVVRIDNLGYLTVRADGVYLR